MLTPLKLKKGGTRAAVSRERVAPPLVGGWNARDAITDMPAEDALELVNWFPQPTHLEMRGGSYYWMGPYGAPVEDLLVYAGNTSGLEIMFACTNQGIYNHTSPNPPQPAKPSLARTSGRHYSTQMGDGTWHWLIACNGVDLPAYYNGGWTAVSGVTSPALTGIADPKQLRIPFTFKNRLLFAANNKLGFYYLPAGVVGGALSYFDLSPFARKSGSLIGMTTWSRDAGTGPDDFAVFFTSAGEALVYQGTDPSSANTWALVGTFDVGRLIGSKAIMRYGSNAIIVTERGVFNLESILQTQPERDQFALSHKIQSEFVRAARTSTYAQHYPAQPAYNASQNWSLVYYPAKNALLVNVPMSNGVTEQYVMNTLSKAWCRFTGWNAEVFAVYRGDLWYASGQNIYRAWTEHFYDSTKLLWVDNPYTERVTADRGEPITYFAKGSYQRYGTENPKHVKLLKPLLEPTNTLTYDAGVAVDLAEGPGLTTGRAALEDDTILRWGVTNWGEAVWGEGTPVNRDWGAEASWPGRWLAFTLRITTASALAKWYGWLFRAEEMDSL